MIKENFLVFWITIFPE